MKLNGSETGSHNVAHARMAEILIWSPFAKDSLPHETIRQFPRLVRLACPRRTVKDNLLLDAQTLQRVEITRFTGDVPALAQRRPVEVEFLSRQELLKTLANREYLIVYVVALLGRRQHVGEGFDDEVLVTAAGYSSYRSEEKMKNDVPALPCGIVFNFLEQPRSFL